MTLRLLPRLAALAFALTVSPAFADEPAAPGDTPAPTDAPAAADPAATPHRTMPVTLIFPSPTRVKGALKAQRAEVESALRDQLKYSMTCFLAAPPTTQPSTANLRFGIGASGAVEAPHVVLTGDGTPEVAACVEKAVAGWTFPTSDGVSKVASTFTFSVKRTDPSEEK